MTISELMRRYLSGEVTPNDHILTLIEKIRSSHSQHLDSAWISIATEELLQQQLLRLESLKSANPTNTLPLYGIPFAVKDNIDVAGWVTTAACPDFAYTPNTTSVAVQKLIDAGAILLGKTNLDQFATGLVGTRSPYGAVPNTFNPKYVSGGSSSGSASVVARGLVCFSLGTDTAGSGRIPAAFNNIVGTKPTPGLISTEGVFPACRSLDCVSIMTLTAADADAVFNILKSTPLDRMQEFRFHPTPVAIEEFKKPIRIGIPASCQFFDQGQYQKSFNKALEKAKGLAAEFITIDLEPFITAGKLLYEGPWVSERFAAIEDFLKSNPDSFDDSVKKIVEGGKSFSAADGFKAIYKLKELERKAMMHSWSVCDVIIVPSAPNHPTIEDVMLKPIEKNSELGVYTNYVNLMRLCAVAVPAGFTDDQMPFGVTLLAQEGRDGALLKLAAAWQKVFDLPLGALDFQVSQAELDIPEAPKECMQLAVVGAHLNGMPLHYQLTDRKAHLVKACKSAKSYHLFALPNTNPPKPGLVRTHINGSAIDLEIYEIPISEMGSFLNLVPSPLGIGNIELEDGTWVKGFICEPYALEGATDISNFGGWKPYTRH